MKVKSGTKKFRPPCAADIASFFSVVPAKIWLLVLLACGIATSHAEALDKVRTAVSNPNLPNLTVAIAQQTTASV